MAEKYPNMPKFQMCPDCGANVKRHHKTETGAVYICRCSLKNDVTHPAFKEEK